MAKASMDGRWIEDLPGEVCLPNHATHPPPALVYDPGPYDPAFIMPPFPLHRPHHLPRLLLAGCLIASSTLLMCATRMLAPNGDGQTHYTPQSIGVQKEERRGGGGGGGGDMVRPLDVAQVSESWQMVRPSLHGWMGCITDESRGRRGGGGKS